MAVTSCPHCNMPLTADEASWPRCPVCQTPFRAESPAPERPSRRWLGLTLGGVAVVGLLLLGWWFFWPGPVKETPAQVAQVKPAGDLGPRQPEEKSIEGKPVEPKTDGVKPPEPKEKDTNPPTTKPDPKDEGVKPSEPKIEAKPVLPKPVLPKPVEPKPAEPMVKPKEKAPPAKKEEQPRAAEPKQPAKGFTLVPMLAVDAIKIDGDLADWKDVPPVLLQAVERGPALKKPVVIPKTQKAYLAYCSKGLLVAVDVIDTSGALENQAKPEKGMWPFWLNDAVEIYVDTLNTKAHQRGEPNAHQFFALPFGAANDGGAGGFESRILEDLAGRTDWTIVPQPLVRAARKTKAGWSMEILIPTSALRLGEVKPGQVFGFELQIDTGTNIWYFWACDDPRAQVSTHPNRWGEVVFAGSDAIIELLDDKQKPAASFIPGQPLTVRVTDPDMNLDSSKKDKVGVLIHNAAGDATPLWLEETQPDSGVFVGVIATKIGGPGAEKVIAVANDDTLVIEYTDHLRGNGARNVPLRPRFPAAKPKR